MRVSRPLALLVSAAVSVSTLQVLTTPASAETPAPAASSSSPTSPSPDEALSRPDVPSAQAAARLLGRRVLIESETTEDTQVFVNADGTFRSQIAAAPVRVRQGQKWVDIDPTLVRDGGQVRPRAAKGNLSLSAGGGTATGGADLLTLTGAGGKPLAMRWPGVLPVPSLSGRTATYADVAPGVDLTVTALRDGYEDSIIVKSASSTGVKTPVWRFPLKATGLTAKQDAGTGLITFVDAGGRTAAYTAPARMFDAQRDPATGDPIRTGEVTTELLTAKNGTQEIRLTPEPGFFTDPATVFPVTIDPTTHVGEVNDAWVAQRTDLSTYNTSVSPTEMRVGHYAGNGSTVPAAKHRSFISFNTSSIANQKVYGATLSLYQYAAIPTCNTSGTAVYALTGSFSDSTTWPGPGLTTPAAAVRTTNCAQNAWYAYDLTTLTDNWANGRTANHGVTVRAANETQTQSYWRFYGGQYTGAQVPSLAVDYNRPPSTPYSLTPPNGSTFKRSPILSAIVNDPELQNVALAVTVTGPGGSVAVDNQHGTPVASGSRASVTIPAITTYGTYSWTARAFDGVEYSAPTAPISFTINPNAVGDASVSSPAYPANTWTPAGGPGTFTFTSPVNATQDADRFGYWIDNGPTQSVMATVSGSQAVATVTLTPSPGWHTLSVYAMDASGANSVTTTRYAFGAKPAMAKPTHGAQVTGTIQLQATGPAATLKYQYRTSGGAFTDIPLADITDDNGTPRTSWPTTSGGSAPTAPLRWDIGATLAAQGANVAADGGVAVDIQAVFGTAGSWDTNFPTTVTYTPSTVAPSHATDEIGPGAVDLLTGNLAVAETDAEVTTYGGDVTVGRTFNSRQPTATGPWGPGWISSLLTDASDYTSLTNTGGSVSVLTADGTQLTFAKTSTGTYRPVADAAAAHLSLTKSATTTGTDWRYPDWFELRDAEGTVVTFTSSDARITPSLATPQRYLVARVETPGQNNRTQYAYTNGQVTQITPPNVGNSTCTTTSWHNSCRVLLLTYDSPTPSATSKLTRIDLKAYDATRTSTGGSVGLVTIPVACYSYDSNGRLAQAWDPRVASATPTCTTSAGAAPVSYTYNTAGRLATVTEAGLAPHQLSYDSNGKLLTASRTHTGGGTETETVAYNAGVNIGGSPLASTDESRPDLSKTNTARWAQTANPVTATATYGPGDTVGDLRDATVHALDGNGRELNTATFSGTGQAGWKIATSEYDADGLLMRNLTPANRELALDPSAGDANLQLPTDTPSRARALDTTNIYARNTDGLHDLISVFGPLHMVTLNDGSYRAARELTDTTYGQVEDGAASNLYDPLLEAPRHHVKKTSVSASLSQIASWGNETDTRTTENFYALNATGTDNEGWLLKQPVKTVTYVPQSQDIVRITRYDPATGQVMKTQMPSDPSGTGAGTTLSSYYAAGIRSDAGCVNDAWVGQLCKTYAAAAPSSGPELPSTHTSYDYALRPVTVSQSVNGSSSYDRVTTTTYQHGGISPRVDRVATTGGQGTVLPATVTHYDAATGLVDYTEFADGTGRVSTGYDDFGRVTSHTDADNETTSTAYDSRGRVATVSNSKQTLTYGYDSATERRGLVTSLTASAISTSSPFTGIYNADGTLVRQTYPDGLVQTTTVDETGDPRSLTYSRGGTTIISDTQDSNIHGQWRRHAGYGSSQAYTYDNAGRLSQVDDTVATTSGNSCSRRAYTFDVNSNRKTKISSDCSGGNATTTSYSYDSADRLLSNTYDAWGRTTTVNGAGNAITAAYYNTDLVQQLSDGTTTRSWTLDAAGRRRTMSDNTGPAKTSHYDSTDDNPGWIDEGNGNTTTYTAGLDGDMTAATTAGATTYQLTNLHGDTITTIATGASTPGVALDTDEFGNPHQTAGSRYGWLGSKQRSSEAVGGLILMGVRLYSPALGRFLSVDPIVGGNANAYDYCTGDPVNCFDLDGRWSVKRLKRLRGAWKTGFRLAYKYRSELAFGAALLGCAACAVGVALWNVGVHVRSGKKGWQAEAANEALGVVMAGGTYRMYKAARRAKAVGAARKHRDFQRRAQKIAVLGGVHGYWSHRYERRY